MSRLLRAGAVAPARFDHAAFSLEPLTFANLELDYEAYMASPDVIRVHSDRRWPVEGFTIDDDRELVAAHECDFAEHRAFAYVVVDAAMRIGLGCVYVNPLHEYFGRVGAAESAVATFPASSAMVTFWIRADRQATGLPRVLVESVNRWLVDEWPIDAHVFRILPGEEASLRALEAAGLTPTTLDLPGDPRPYLWFR